MRGPSTATRVAREPATTDLAQRLLAAYFDELAERFPGGLEPDPAHAAPPDQLSPPGGAFIVIRAGGQPVGCGGLRRLDDQTAEVKHMWIDPVARGRGLGRELLAALESEALSLGYARIRLDTSRHLHEAAALYRASGYRSIRAYNENPYAAHWFEKHLPSGGEPA